MKLSNKVLVGFFGFIFLYLTAAFAELRLTGINNAIEDDNSVAETVDLIGIAQVIINDLSRNINIIGSDQPRIEVRSLSGNMLKNLTYDLSGDTIRLSGFQSEENKRVGITLFVHEKSLRAIAITGSTVTIKGLHQDHLHISQNSGQIWMSDDKIARVEMDLANGSFLHISEATFDTLSVAVDRSQLQVYSPVGLLQGSIKNDAFLHVNGIQEIQLKKDKTSRLNLLD